MHAVVASAVSLAQTANEWLVLAKDKPVDEDTNIVAGWTALWIFLAMIAAVAVIGVALTRSLRKADRSQAEGAYGDQPAEPDSPTASE